MHEIEKIMAKNSGRSQVSPGEIVTVKIDFAEINDLYLQTVYSFYEMGGTKVWDNNSQEIGSHCLSGVDEAIASNFPQGGIVVAGRNFGCGSSREHAPIALLNMGAAAVLADSFARIFFRNAINLGLPVVTCKGIHDHVQDGDRVTLDLEAGTVTVEKTGEVLACDQLGEQVQMILEAGGIKPMMRKRFGASE